MFLYLAGFKRNLRRIMSYHGIHDTFVKYILKFLPILNTYMLYKDIQDTYFLLAGIFTQKYTSFERLFCLMYGGQ